MLPWLYSTVFKLVPVVIARVRDATLPIALLPSISSRFISRLKSSTRRVVASTSKEPTRDNTNVNHSTMELDSHADTIVASSNCVVLNYTCKVCDVSPYRDDYEPINDVPVVCAATA